MAVVRCETSVGMLGRVQSGDGDAWNQFAQHCQQVILSWCRWRRVPQSEVDDIMQDSLVVVLTKIHAFRRNGRGSLRAWLYAIAWRCRCDALGKAESYSRLREVREKYREATNEIDALELEFERLQQVDLLERCMAIVRGRVQQKTWEAFRLHALERVSGADVAAALDLSVDKVHTAKARVQRMIQVEMRRLTQVRQTETD